MRPGKRERREFEYIRHGTQTLIVSFDVASGQVAQGSVGDTRTEADYLTHVQQLIATDPNAMKWHLMLLKHTSIRNLWCGLSHKSKNLRLT